MTCFTTRLRARSPISTVFRERAVAPDADAVAALDALDIPLPDESRAAKEVIELLDRHGSPATMGMAGPRFFGFVIGGSVPVSLAANWLATAWDQNTGLYNITPATARIEQTALRWLIELLDLPRDCGGAFVTGATVANFVALAAARHAVLERVGWKVEADGLFGAPPITVVMAPKRIHVDQIARFARARPQPRHQSSCRRTRTNARRCVAVGVWPDDRLRANRKREYRCVRFDRGNPQIASARMRGCMSMALSVCGRVSHRRARNSSKESSRQIRGQPTRTNGSTFLTTAVWPSYATPMRCVRRWRSPRNICRRKVRGAIHPITRRNFRGAHVASTSGRSCSSRTQRRHRNDRAQLPTSAPLRGRIERRWIRNPQRRRAQSGARLIWRCGTHTTRGRRRSIRWNVLVRRHRLARQDGYADQCLFVGHDGCGCRAQYRGDRPCLAHYALIATDSRADASSHDRSVAKKFMNRRVAKTFIASALLVVASSAAHAFDRDAWRQDYAQLKTELERRYANLAWFASAQGGVNLSALDRRTQRFLDLSQNDDDAKSAILNFVSSFHDGHFSQVPTLGPAAGKSVDPPKTDFASARSCSSMCGARLRVDAQRTVFTSVRIVAGLPS